MKRAEIWGHILSWVSKYLIETKIIIPSDMQDNDILKSEK